MNGHECDPHMALARSESADTPLVCGTCGNHAQGNYSDDDGEVCDACAADGARPPVE